MSVSTLNYELNINWGKNMSNGKKLPKIEEDGGKKTKKIWFYLWPTAAMTQFLPLILEIRLFGYSERV